MHKNNDKSEILYDNHKLIIITDQVKIKGDKLEMSDNFKDFIKKIEENNINQTYKNSSEWFQKEIPFNIINEMYLSKLNDNLLEINNEKNIECDNEKVIIGISGLRIERKTFTIDIKLMNTYEEYNIMEYDLLEEIEENKKKELLNIKNIKNKLLEELKLLENKKDKLKKEISDIEEKELKLNNY